MGETLNQKRNLELFEISGQVVLKKFCKNFKCMRIIVIALGGLGDILMTTPMIKVLRSAYPKAKIDTITMLPSSYEILKNNPNLNNVIYYPFLKEGYSRSLFFLLKNFSFKRGFYDVSITLYPSYPKEGLSERMFFSLYRFSGSKGRQTSCYQ